MQSICRFERYLAGVDANVAGNNYDKYASTNPIEQRMMAGFFEAFDRMLDGSEPDLIVEVGAGEGRVTCLLYTSDAADD